MTIDDAATMFILHAIQDWGQSDDERIEAVQGVLDAVGFDATATCGPVFGGIWPEACSGKDGLAATSFLQELTDTMERGKFQREEQHIIDAIAKAKAQS